MDEESSQLIIEVKIQRWQFKSCQLSLACWPTLSVGFDRPFTQSTRKSLSFLWASLRAPSAAEREGDIFGCADLFGYQSVNPLSFRHHYLTVMWWNFFIPKGVRHAYYIFKCSFSFLPQCSLWRCLRQVNPTFYKFSNWGTLNEGACSFIGLHIWIILLLICRATHSTEQSRQKKRQNSKKNIKSP